jgi:AcrR family transcriptional regulator
VTGRAYRPRRPSAAPARTRAKILTAVRELLAEDAFHTATVEEVAARAGISRATLYQHFGSRTGLVDALCDTFDATEALQAVRRDVELPDAEEGLAATIAHVVEFWGGEEPVLAPLYGVAAVDPAAEALVARQLEDRRGEMKRLARGLRASGRLRPEVTDRLLLAHLLLLTSFETFVELRRRAGFSQREVVATLQASARTLLLSG